MTSKPKLKNLFIRSKEINLLTTTLKLKKKYMYYCQKMYSGKM